MNTIYRLFTSCGAFFILLSCQPKSNPNFPKPSDGTQVKWDMEEGTKSSARAAWIENMHAIEESKDWKEIETQNTWDQYQEKLKSESIEKNNIEEIADGNIQGRWIERGSHNQAGSILGVEYDAARDEIFAVSAGGTLFRSNRSGDNWRVVNQDLRFNGNFFEIITFENGNLQLICAIGNDPYFSKDEGLTWQKNSNIDGDNGAHYKDPIVLEQRNGEKILFVLYRKDWWANVRLLASYDHGESYKSVRTFFTSDMNNLAVSHPSGTNDLYVMEQLDSNKSRLMQYNPASQTLLTLRSNTDLAFGEDGRGNLNSFVSQDTLILKSYNESNDYFESRDTGASWTQIGTLPETPWSVSIYMSPSDPNLLYLGEVNSHKSYNGGKSWEKVNEWWEYYDDVTYKMHADFMEFDEFQDPDGNPFVLIANHGGLSLSTDSLNTNLNIGLQGLNVSQYYDVVTDPADPYFVYAGTQDQGLQRGLLSDDELPSNFEQVISGDYGHGVFTGPQNAYWTVYPDGWITYYSNARSGYYDFSWQLPNPNKAVWIPPIVKSPFEDFENVVYLAGGSKSEVDNGSYIHRLEAHSTSISHIQYPFNFNINDDRLTHLAFSNFDESIWYAITENGVFYISDSAGNDFITAGDGLPSSHYLYGSYILPSKTNPDHIYIAGSGYSNPPVWKSTDGGMNFEPMNEGLPRTLVFELASNEDESLLFAATEAGPYVYISAENQWFSMQATAAPNQRYWSVEFVEEINTVRFGTYGRGIWDFVIEYSTASEELNEQSVEVNLYPNPASNTIHIKSDIAQLGKGTIYGIDGKLQMVKNVNMSNDIIDIKGLTNGTYILALETKSRIVKKIFIKNE